MEYEQEHLVDLVTLAGGAAVERFNRELQRVLDNIQDPNTLARQKRAVTLTVTFMPDVDRRKADIDIDVKPTLATDRTTDTTVWFGKKDGKNVAAEANPNQGTLFDKDRPAARLIAMPQRKEENDGD